MKSMRLRILRQLGAYHRYLFAMTEKYKSHEYFGFKYKSNYHLIGDTIELINHMREEPKLLRQQLTQARKVIEAISLTKKHEEAIELALVYGKSIVKITDEEISA